MSSRGRGIPSLRKLAWLAAVSALAGCGDFLQEPDTGIFPAPVALVPLAGGGQTGAPGTSLPEPLEVRILDDEGRPIPRLWVEWTPLPGSGEARPRNSFSDEDGIARTRWILGPEPGPQEIRAAVGKGVPTVFEGFAASP